MLISHEFPYSPPRQSSRLQQVQQANQTTASRGRQTGEVSTKRPHSIHVIEPHLFVLNQIDWALHSGACRRDPILPEH